MVQMWVGWTQSRCRCGWGKPSPGADLGGGEPSTLLDYQIDVIVQQSGSEVVVFAGTGQSKNKRDAKHKCEVRARPRPCSGDERCEQQHLGCEQRSSSGRCWRNRCSHNVVAKGNAAASQALKRALRVIIAI